MRQNYVKRSEKRRQIIIGGDDILTHQIFALFLEHEYITFATRVSTTTIDNYTMHITTGYRKQRHIMKINFLCEDLTKNDYVL